MPSPQVTSKSFPYRCPHHRFRSFLHALRSRKLRHPRIRTTITRSPGHYHHWPQPFLRTIKPPQNLLCMFHASPFTIDTRHYHRNVQSKSPRSHCVITHLIPSFLCPLSLVHWPMPPPQVT